MRIGGIMGNQFLAFTLHGSQYAINTMMVKEMHHLPLLTHVEELPSYVPGVYNLRGKIIPVIDLHILFGYPPEKYRINDSIIVLELEGILIGIIVNDVYDVVTIQPEDIETVRIPSHKPHMHHLISGEARVGEDIIMILDYSVISRLDRVIQEKGGLDSLVKTENDSFEEKSGEYFKPEWESKIQNPNSEILVEFHKRALNLMQPVVSEDLTGLMPTAVIGLDGEFFGIELENVREVADMKGVTPIPCCPKHIVGNMNLRGNILTLIDIREILNLPLNRFTEKPKIVVAGVEELLVGLVVDDILDVVYLKPSEIIHVPSAIIAESEEYLRGNAPYRGRMMTLLNLSKILKREELIVNQEA